MRRAERVLENCSTATVQQEHVRNLSAGEIPAGMVASL